MGGTGPQINGSPINMALQSGGGGWGWEGAPMMSGVAVPTLTEDRDLAGGRGNWQWAWPGQLEGWRGPGIS